MGFLENRSKIAIIIPILQGRKPGLRETKLFAERDPANEWQGWDGDALLSESKCQRARPRPFLILDNPCYLVAS